MEKRPIFLTLWQIRFPLTAIVSILHRLSGVFLFFLIPSALALLQKLLGSEQEFWVVKNFFQSLWVEALFGLALVSLLYHLLAGLRHLLADFGLGETKMGGHLSACLVLGLSILVVSIMSVFLWFH